MGSFYSILECPLCTGLAGGLAPTISYWQLEISALRRQMMGRRALMGAPLGRDVYLAFTAWQLRFSLNLYFSNWPGSATLSLLPVCNKGIITLYHRVPKKKMKVDRV